MSHDRPTSWRTAITMPPMGRGLWGAAEVITIAKDLKVNEQIRVRQIRLIGGEGEQIGIIDTRDAMQMAREKGLDLVMVSPQAVPPVCRLLDYGRFRYEQQQNEKENRKRARSQEVKSIKYRVKIDDNDFNTKTNQVEGEEGGRAAPVLLFLFCVQQLGLLESFLEQVFVLRYGHGTAFGQIVAQAFNLAVKEYLNFLRQFEHFVPGVGFGF